MHSNRWRWIGRFLVIALALVAILTFVVMGLWNWLAPSLFGWREISFVQAAGLLLLCRILFGGLRGYAGMHWRQRWAERWERMTPEQREQFRASMRGCCGRSAEETRDAQNPASAA